MAEIPKFLNEAHKRNYERAIKTLSEIVLPLDLKKAQEQILRNSRDDDFLLLKEKSVRFERISEPAFTYDSEADHLSNPYSGNILKEEDVASTNRIRDEIAARLEESANSHIEVKEEAREQPSRHEREHREKQLTFDYAKEEGVWIDDLYTLGSPMLGGGNENTLALSPEGSVFKSNNLFNSKFLVSNLLEQVRIHNLLFPETRYEVAGVTGFEKGGNNAPYIEIILKQRFVENSTRATPEEISDHMISIGFEKINETTFTNGKYIVSDLRPRNVLKDEKGAFHVIDNIISWPDKPEDILKAGQPKKIKGSSFL